MLALLIEDVTLIKKREITVAVRFRGGATHPLTLPRPLKPTRVMTVTGCACRAHQAKNSRAA